MQYALIENGQVANIIEADDAAFIATLPGHWVPVAQAAGIGWSYSAGLFTEPEAAALALPRRVTRLAFRGRFSTSEKTAIELAALDDPAAAMAERQQAAALRAYLKDVDAASFINLDLADTRAGVQWLEDAGIIAPGRASEVLNAPVQPHEMPG